MDRPPKYLYTFWFEKLEDFSRAETIRLSNRNMRIWTNPRQAPQERTSLKESLPPIWSSETDRNEELEMATAVIEDTFTPGSGLTYDDSKAVIFDLDGNGYNLYGELIEPATHTSLPGSQKPIVNEDGEPSVGITIQSNKPCDGIVLKAMPDCLTKIPEWLQDYADKFRGLHISADDRNGSFNQGNS